MGLCFAIFLWKVLIIKGCLANAEQCLYSDKAFSAFYTTPPVRTLRVHKKLGSNTVRTADPNGQSFIPHDIMFSIQSWEKEEKVRGTVEKMAFCLTMSLLQMMESCFHGDGWMLACLWDSVNELLVLLYLCLWLLHYLLKCLYLRIKIFSFFFSSNSLSHPTRWDWESSCVGLIWWLGLNNDIHQKQSCFRL